MGMEEEKSSLIEEEMVSTFRSSSFASATMQLNGLQAAVLEARAQSSMNLSDKDARQLAMRWGVMNLLFRMHIFGSTKKGGVLRARGFITNLGMGTESKLANYWFKTYYEEIVGHNQERCFILKKSLAAVLVWALYLTPTLAFDLSMTAENELRLPDGHIRMALENIGCSVSSLSGKHIVNPMLRVKLKNPPKAEEDDERAKKRSRGGGRGRGGRR